MRRGVWQELGLFLQRWRGLPLNLALIAALVLSILLLPPVAACNRLAISVYTAIGQEGGSVLDPDGTQVTISSLGANLLVRLQSIPRLHFLEGRCDERCQVAAVALPRHLQLKSPLYDLQVYRDNGLPREPGAMVDLVTYTIPVPNDSEPYNALALYEWDGRVWRFLPSHVIPEDDVIEAHLDHLPGLVGVFHQEPVVPVVSVDLADNSPLEAILTAADELNPAGLYMEGDGSIAGQLPSLPAGSIPAEKRLVPVVRNWAPGDVVRSDYTDNILAIRELGEAHIEALLQLVSEGNYPGVELEYRDINPALREQFTDFVRRLADRLHQAGKSLGLRVPFPIQVAEDRWDTGAYDWRELGRYVDKLVVPAPAAPEAYRPGGQAEQLLSFAVGEVERYKLFVSLPALSTEKVLHYVLHRSYDEILESLGDVSVVAASDVAPGQALEARLSGLAEWSGLQYDEATRSYWFAYKDPGGGEHTVYIEDPASLAYKLVLIGSYRVRGVQITGQGQHPGIWPVLADFHDLTIVEPEVPVQLALELQGGQRVALPAGAGAIALSAPAEPGQYALAPALVVGELVALSAKATAVRVAAAMPTATPRPTAAPAPAQPTPAPQQEKPTPAPQEQQEAPPPTPTPVPQQAAPPAPAPSSGAVGFGYGVQAHMIHNGQAPQCMALIKGMGFNWVKQQIEWKLFEPSKGNYVWGPIDEVVNAANAAGINVLLSVVKAPAWARPAGADLSVEGPPANPQDFADFLGAMAAHFRGRVRAYEVWNEQNLHYEWGNQPIDPAAYMALLKPAYAAIKANDPNALVISGALTPTGAPAPWAMDDFLYLEGMYQNGLRNYCDGVGAHPSGYNVPPDADWRTVTDDKAIFRGPFDNRHHSWSFRATMEGYRNIMVKYGDANKRIWPTEFGWASSPTPVVNYEYAADNTLEEQAQWTVRAYQMMKAWGWVGPAFLWNLNFKVVAPGSEQAQWGIVDEAWNPLPVYQALAAMPK